LTPSYAYSFAFLFQVFAKEHFCACCAKWHIDASAFSGKPDMGGASHVAGCPWGVCIHGLWLLSLAKALLGEAQRYGAQPASGLQNA
jgi:hypothetical protein